MIAREGYRLVAGAVVLGVLLVIVAVWMESPWSTIPLTVAILIVSFTIFFFRDPERVPTAGSDTRILAPADGKVVVVDDIHEPLFLNATARRVSIFLSPLNVHVNRIPVGGVIRYENYVPGDYLVAWHPKASELNERSELGVEHPSGARVLFKQIAGALARRVIYHVKVGDRVEAGERFGIVKFGSRMDVLAPADTEIRVKVGDRVRGGLTVLGELRTNGVSSETRTEHAAISPAIQGRSSPVGNAQSKGGRP